MAFQKLGILADIHGNALALRAVLADARQMGVTRFVNLGDVLYGPLQPLETYKILQQTPMVATILGNQDRQIFAATEEDLAANTTLAFVSKNLVSESPGSKNPGADPVAWLRSLPATAVVDGSVFLCHGTPSSDTTYLLEDISGGYPTVRSEDAIMELLGSVREPVVLCGHSHLPRMVQLSNGQLIVNPGSVGLPAYGEYEPFPHFMESYAPHASYAILKSGPSGWDASFHRVSYAWSEAAKQARDLDRNDWAQGIETGRMG